MRFFRLILSIAVLITVLDVHAQDEKRALEKILLLPGFHIQIFADNVPGARSMALGESGTVFVGTRTKGKVYALRDTTGDGGMDSIITIADGLYMPNGVAFKDGNLYVAEVHRIWKYSSIENHLPAVPTPSIVNDTFPRDRHHGWKFIAFGPDGLLYVPVGAPCNVCESADARYASIMRMKPDGTELEVFVRGVRNTVGFDWHPQTKQLWFTENGRDWMGDNLPPDELNTAPVKGLHFGFPYRHGANIIDPEYGDKGQGIVFTPPAGELDPHVAAIGMRFYTAQQFPEKYRNRIFIAEHGSWNRSTPIGYRIMMVTLDKNAVQSYEVFAQGWLQSEGVWGRPADVMIYTDGSLLVSDDYAGVIYRIYYDAQDNLPLENTGANPNPAEARTAS